MLLGDAEEVKRRAARSTHAAGRSDRDDPLIIWLLIVAFIIWINYRNAPGDEGQMPGTPRRNGGIIVIPGGSGNWGGGWSSGGDSGGGGWSGGGGDFGGGGASGGW